MADGLAADSELGRKSGGIYSSYALAEEYDLDDIDGRRPNMPKYIEEHVAGTWGRPAAAWSWQLERGEATAMV